MKALFPCKGSIILAKEDISRIQDFYIDNLTNSKLFPLYDTSNYSVEVNSFYYLPKQANILLDNANFLTLNKLYEAISDSINMPLNNQPLDDNFILDNPFFETLKPLN